MTCIINKNLDQIKITLNLFKDMAAKEASEIGILVCNIDAERKLPGNNMALPWFEFSDWINKTIKA